MMTITLLACEKESTRPKDLPESVVQLTKNDNGCICEPQISLFRWNGQLLYVYHTTGPACDSYPLLFDEEGNRAELTEEEHYTFWEEKELVRVIWKCGE